MASQTTGLEPPHDTHLPTEGPTPSPWVELDVPHRIGGPRQGQQAIKGEPEFSPGTSIDLTHAFEQGDAGAGSVSEPNLELESESEDGDDTDPDYDGSEEGSK